MTRYSDKGGNRTFDDATVAKMAADIESDAVPLVSLSGLTQEEVAEYMCGDPSRETLAKLRPVRFSNLQSGVTDPSEN